MYGKLCKSGDEEKAIQIAQQKQEQCIREGKTRPSEMCMKERNHENSIFTWIGADDE